MSNGKNKDLINKYRPYLSGIVIKYLKNHSATRLANEVLDKTEESILTELYVACMKLELSMLKDANPAYVPSASPKVSITDKLGITGELLSTSLSISLSDSDKLSQMTKEDADKVVKDYEDKLMASLLEPSPKD